MQLKNLKLEDLKEPLHVALGEYERFHDGVLRFGDVQDFRLTPEKPNSARTEVPTMYRGDKIGSMSAITFLPGDGTGDTNTYKHGQLAIPQRLRYREKPERVFPRSKTGVVAEGFFPFFSVNNGSISMFDPYLEELVVDNINKQPGIVHGWEIGRSDYRNMETEPRVYFTVGTDRTGRRIGDPHAIHYHDGGNAARVVGFLALNNPEHLDLTRDWIMPRISSTHLHI